MQRRQETMDTTRWEYERIQVSRHWYLNMAKWKEVLQVDLGTDERTCTDRAVQWEQRSQELETMSRGTLLEAVKGAIFTERSPSAIRTERADRVDLLAVGWKWEPEKTGRAPVEAITRKGKGSTDKKQGNSKGKDTEKEEGKRVEGYCGHCGNGGTDKRVVCWSRQVCRTETDTAELQDVDLTSK